MPKPQVYSWGSNFDTFYHYFRKFRNSGHNYTLWSAFGLSAFLGYIKLFPRIAYSSDGSDGLLDGHHLGLFSDSDSEEDRRSLLMSIRKLVVPLLLVITVVMNWDQSIIIAAKVTLILLTTMPSPLSVYVLVEQLQNQAIRQQPFIYKLKVELKDQELTLVGILGS